MLSFKDFTPVQYTGGETEMQDRYAFKRHHGVVGEADRTSSETISKIRGRIKENRERRAKHKEQNSDRS
jgi:hypothetical protein